MWALIPFDNLTHHKGDPELETDPFGLLPQGMIVYALDSAGKDLYRITPHGKRRLKAVFTQLVPAHQPVPTNLLEGPDGRLYATLFFCIDLIEPEAGARLSRVRCMG